jgi:PTS system mannose-specific IIA component
MVGILIATHGDISRSLLETAVDLVGEPATSAAAITLDDNQDRTQAWDSLVAAVDSVDSGDGVLLLVDMFGSTSSTLALSLLADKSVEVLTGVNLAMVLRALLNRGETDLPALAEDVLSYGRRNVTSSATWLGTSGQNEGNER